MSGVAVERPPVEVRRRRRRAPDAVYFALRNPKLLAGLTVVLAFLALAAVGPGLTDKDPLGFDGDL